MSLAFPLFPLRSRRFFTGWRLRSLTITALGLGLLASAIAPATALDEPQADLTDGVHVFGESATAGQLGTTYMVMSVDAGQVIGGFYQPSSSFDCFRGEIAQNELTLTVIDSYAQTEYPFALALENRAAIASPDTVGGEWVPSGFQAISEHSDTDRQVLQACSS